MRSPSGDRGSVSVELAILTPVFALMLSVVLLVGRTQSSRADIDAAAHAATRSISLARDPAAAAATARDVTADRLQVGSPSCESLTWDVEITDTDVTVRLACSVDLTEAVLLPVPGSVEVGATATEVLDRFAEGPRS